MARRKTKPNGPGLFDEQERHLERRIRRQRALFIPRFLREEATKLALQGKAQDRAYEIAVHWAKLETDGHLPTYKETSIDTQFLDQIFGEGFGYKLKTTSPDAWQLEHKYFVTDVGTADAALGNFPESLHPNVLVELKGSLIDLDRDRFNGRTAVQQCWDYLNAVPSCAWGIVSNFKAIRLYHREKGTLGYEEFTLQELRDRARFNEFYFLFERNGLLPTRLGQVPRAIELLQRTQDRQKTVGDELYRSYQSQRLRLIEHLMQSFGKELDPAIRLAQKLLDRIIFIAFCEDRDLLHEECLDRAWHKLPAFTKATNPRWQNFLALFGEVDSGGLSAGVEQGYNGNLFKHDEEIDTLKLADDPWTNGFKNIGTFDFSEEVNVEVLGHLFERSVTELEKLRVGGLFALKAGAAEPAAAPAAKGKKKPAKSAAEQERSISKMPKSAQRKRFGIYYTPAAFTRLIVERTVDAVAAERFLVLQRKHNVDPEARENQDPKQLLAYWTDCLESLKTITVCDPACGSGAFLIRAYDALDAHYKTVVHGLAGAGLAPEQIVLLEDSIPEFILQQNLYGVDLSQEAVEITQLALWIRSARRNRKLSDLSQNIVCGNSLVSDPAVDSKALRWQATFPRIFGKHGTGGFTCVIGNPPWEQIMLHDREFFAMTDPAIATAVSAADRDRMIEKLPATNPQLHSAYVVADANARRMLKYVRESGDFPLTAKGRTNLYMLFAERARTIVATEGLIGLLVPSGIATDDNTKEFFNDLMDGKRLVSLYDFENKAGHFQDVHRSFKFTAIIINGEGRKTEMADFVFFARRIEQTAAHNKQYHIPLTAADMALFNPNTRTCPIFRTRRDATLTKLIYKRIPILIDKNRKRGGNPWGIVFKQGLFNQTSDAKKFQKPAILEKKGFKLAGNRWVKAKNVYLPLYEAKMLQAFDHRAAGIMIEESNWMRQGQSVDSSIVQHANPEFLAVPRWWVAETEVDEALPDHRAAYIAYKRVTSATNSRTMIASMLPRAAAVNSVCLMMPDSALEPRIQCALLANLNAYVFDYVARQKVGAVDLNFFIVEQLPTFPPDAYADKCPWSKRETLERWISERVLRLSCTAEDMIPLAKACDFKGSREDGVHIWKEAERAAISAELDAAYFHLYGIEREDVEYVLSTFSNTGFVREDERGAQQVLWNRGSTGEMILGAYDRLAAAS